MRSIAVSMAWEVFRRGRWNFLAAMLGAIAFPTLLFLGLRQNGPLPTEDKSMLIMSFIVMQVMALAFSAAVYDAQGKVSRLYAYPIRSSEIVVFRLLPAMAIIALQMILVSNVLNTLFGFQWPIWGPAILAAAAFALIEGAIWLTEKSTGWLVVAVSTIGGVVGLWFKSRFGNTFSDPQHSWDFVTPMDAATMLAFAAAGFGLAVFAVARNRRGEAPLSIGLVDWVGQVFDGPRDVASPFSGPPRALSWSEWRRKGWVMPIGTLMLLVIGFVAWLVCDRSVDNLFSGLVVGGFTLTLFGFIGGVVFGNTGRNDADYVMGNFLATRPISDSELARVYLTTATKSLLLAWSIWAAAVGIVFGCTLVFWSSGRVHLPSDLGWWYFVLTPLAAWMSMGATMSLALTGRTRQVLQLFCVLSVLIVAEAAASKYALSPRAHLLLMRTTAAAIGSCILAVGIGLFVAAHRRDLISTSTKWAGAAVWLAGTALVASLLPESSEPQIVGVLLGAAGVALVIVPIAAAPLAISVNRHR